MRSRLVWLGLLLWVVPALFAKDVYLSIGGSVGSFRTDARIFNPSQTKDIQIQAYYLPVGNVDNSRRHADHDHGAETRAGVLRRRRHLALPRQRPRRDPPLVFR